VSVGGWELSGTTASFEYLLQTPVSDRKCGRVLAGWHADGGGLSPRLTAIPAYDQESQDFNIAFHNLMTNWINDLFGVNVGKYAQSYRELLMATLMLRHREYQQRYGRDNFVVKRMTATALECGVTPEQLMNCCDHVRQDWIQRNVQFLPVAMLREVDSICLDAKTFTGAIQTLAAIMTDMNSRLARIEAATTRTAVGKTFFTPDKRELNVQVRSFRVVRVQDSVCNIEQE
jgi:hypothetical protein